jgi:hypothetical protein
MRKVNARSDDCSHPRHGDRQTFHEIAVQAHWDNDSVLFGEDGLLYHLLEDQALSHIVLFDEFNLTGPEYYLSRLFHVLDGSNGAIASGT